MSLLSDRELQRSIECAEAWRVDDEARAVHRAECTMAERCMERAGFLPVPFPGEALGISPLDPEAIQPASVDLCLGGGFRYWPIGGPDQVIDPLRFWGGLQMRQALLEVGAIFDMAAGEFVLAHTVEAVTLGACLAGQVYGKSSIGRLGLEVENAGYIDPGFSGQITLELKNTTSYTIRLTVGMPIAQMAVHRLSSTAVRPYGHPDRSSRYMGQMGATPSRYAIGRAPLVSEVDRG